MVHLDFISTESNVDKLMTRSNSCALCAQILKLMEHLDQKDTDITRLEARVNQLLRVNQLAATVRAAAPREPDSPVASFGSLFGMGRKSATTAEEHPPRCGPISDPLF